MSVNDIEPVVPDPRKLRRTAMILVAVMVVGGILIMLAYEKMAKESAKDDRPSFIAQISERKDLVFMRQDGELKELLSLKGKVLVIQCLPSSEVDELTTGVMRRLAGTFGGRDDFALVTLMLDPGDAEALKREVAELAEVLGARLPLWTVASNERETLHKFIKNEFKANMLPYQKDGKWKYDKSLVVVDKNRHVRRAVIPQKRGGAPYVTGFDFEKAAGWDEEGIKTGTDLSNVEELEKLLGKTIEYLLEEEIKP